MSRRIHVRTFGCQMNVHDSERILLIMEREGYAPVDDPDGADLIVVNTCSVREKAYHKVRSAVGRLRILKEGPRPPVIAVAGCVARQEGSRWVEACPHVDIVLGPDAIPRLAGHVKSILDGAPPIVDVEFDEGRPVDFLSLEPDARQGPTAYLTVMKGCSHGCTFCIVPTVRGPMRHRPAREILEEAGKLADAGAREIMLLGQTVNAWQESGRDFAWLLARLDEVPGLERVRYTSPHPSYVTRSLIEAHGSLRALCEHVHLPVQSGSDGVLGRMGRRHDRAHYLAVAGDLRASRPGLTISTDLIVGFPGETDEDFRRTLDLVEEVGFDSFFSFMYSPRPGTPAALFEDDVTAEVKQDRLRRLHALGDRLTRERYASDLGRTVEVLVTGSSRAGRGQLTGRTRTNRIVNFDWDGQTAPVGRLVGVEVTRVLPHCLAGRAS